MEPGRKPMLVIYTAFVVHWSEWERKVVGKFVKDNVFIWPARNGKRLVQKPIWNDLPSEIRDAANANIIATGNDYHGNFNANLFDKLMLQLCTGLEEMGLKNCKIHLDGASYHFRDKNRIPTVNKTLEFIKKWMQENDIPVPQGLSKNQLLEMIRAKNLQPHVTARKIVEEKGHELIKTPPYHCELQPIEKIWAVVKNQIAAQATGNDSALSLKQKLATAFVSIPHHVFISVWLLALNLAEKYRDQIPEHDPDQPINNSLTLEAVADVEAGVGEEEEEEGEEEEADMGELNPAGLQAIRDLTEDDWADALLLVNLDQEQQFLQATVARVHQE
jgi:hypothetical protein